MNSAHLLNCIFGLVICIVNNLHDKESWGSLEGGNFILGLVRQFMWWENKLTMRSFGCIGSLKCSLEDLGFAFQERMRRKILMKLGTVSRHEKCSRNIELGNSRSPPGFVHMGFLDDVYAPKSPAFIKKFLTSWEWGKNLKLVSLYNIALFVKKAMIQKQWNKIYTQWI